MDTSSVNKTMHSRYKSLEEITLKKKQQPLKRISYNQLKRIPSKIEKNKKLTKKHLNSNSYCISMNYTQSSLKNSLCAPMIKNSSILKPKISNPLGYINLKPPPAKKVIAFQAMNPIHKDSMLDLFIHSEKLMGSMEKIKGKLIPIDRNSL